MLEPIKPDLDAIGWIICGGETQTGARYMKPEWARDLRDQCARAEVPFFLKQMTAKKPIPDDLVVRQFPR
jgi:protein gp37